MQMQQLRLHLQKLNQCLRSQTSKLLQNQKQTKLLVGRHLQLLQMYDAELKVCSKPNLQLHVAYETAVDGLIDEYIL